MNKMNKGNGKLHDTCASEGREKSEKRFFIGL